MAVCWGDWGCCGVFTRDIGVVAGGSADTLIDGSLLGGLEGGEDAIEFIAVDGGVGAAGHSGDFAEGAAIEDGVDDGLAFERWERVDDVGVLSHRGIVRRE